MMNRTNRWNEGQRKVAHFVAMRKLMRAVEIVKNLS